MGEIRASRPVPYATSRSGEVVWGSYVSCSWRIGALDWFWKGAFLRWEENPEQLPEALERSAWVVLCST